MKKITDSELENLLSEAGKSEFRPFFSTRVLGKLERYQNNALLGTFIQYRVEFKRYMYAGTFAFAILFGIYYWQEGQLSLNHLLGLGNFTEDELLDYINPLI
jgi:hypothetical protein